MDIAWDAKGEYRKNLEQFLRYGGAHSVAARKACEIEGKLRLGMDVASQTTDHGETRIKNCVKYDLGNGYRLVTVRQAEVVVFVYIGDHDSTQRWLDRHRGLVPVVDRRTSKVEFTIPSAPQPWQIAPQTTVSLTRAPFLSQVCGIDWKVTIKSAATRSFLLRFDEDGDNQDLLDVLGELKEEQPREAELCLVVINSLRSGQHDAAQAAVDLFLGHAVETTDAAPLTVEILRAEANQGRFVVINDLSDEEVARLHDPLRFREWMVFLHPGQRRVAEEEFEGPALLTGVSGSGKTCVLVHRARRLAQFYSQDRVLILTLNQSLARLIEVLIGDLCLGDERGRIEVKAFHDYLSEVLSSLDGEAFLQSLGEFTGMVAEVEGYLSKTNKGERLNMFRPLTEREQLAAFEEFLAEPGNLAKSEFDRLEVFVFSQDQTIDLRRYLFQELELVRSAFTCFEDYQGYLTYEREGRSIAFQGNRRQAILAILREWERFQLRRGFLDMMGLAQAAVFAVEEKGEIPDKFRYRCVLVDEFQDLSTLELSLLRRIPKFDENGLFLSGDFAQKIYTKDLNLPAAKLGPGDRTNRVIRRNYRNSRQVLVAAQALLEAYPPRFADRDEDVVVLKPEYATRESAVPIATLAEDPIAAAWQFAEEWLNCGHVAFSVCIATANAEIYSPESILRRKPAALDADVLTGDYLLKPNRVVVADISAVKGFEFSLMLICGLDSGVFPPKGIPAAEHWREAMKLYVAITRGRDEVRFLHRGGPSLFLEAMGSTIQRQTWTAPEDSRTPEVAVMVADSGAVETPFTEPISELPAVAAPEPPAVPVSVLDFEPGGEEKAETEMRASAIELPLEPSEVAQAGESNAETIASPAEDEPQSPIVETHASGAFVEETAEFAAEHPPEVINGLLVMPLPEGISERELAALLGRTQLAVALACQHQGHFVPPDTPLPDHVIKGVCEQLRIVPNIVRKRLNQTWRWN